MREDSKPTVTKEVLRQLLDRCISQAVDKAQREIAESLPTEYYLTLEAFGQQGKELSLDEVLSFLFRDRTFPRIVDIAVRGIKDGRTLIWIRPSGHAYVSDFAQTWNTPVGMGPFKCIGLMLPQLIWQRSRPLSLQDLREAGENW
jgi:hypothetical protein